MLEMARSSYYYQSKVELAEEKTKVYKEIQTVYEAFPFYRHRWIYWELQDRGLKVGRDRVLKSMAILNLTPLFPNRKTRLRCKKDPVYPYLLRDMKVEQVSQVWAADITYIPLEHGFCYFVGIIDWHSRKILSYRISNAMDRHFCLQALQEACAQYGTPTIFNTDQGSQFTSLDFIDCLKSRQIKVSMDSIGRWADNIIIERFFRSLKYENVYLNRYDSLVQAKAGIKEYIQFYNSRRRHSSLEYKTPNQAFNSLKMEHAA